MLVVSHCLQKCPSLEVIQSNKGGMKLCFEGHLYTKKSSPRTPSDWNVPSMLLSRAKVRDANVEQFLIAFFIYQNINKSK